MMQLADYFACQVSLIKKSNPFKTKTKTQTDEKKKIKRKQGAIFENRRGFVVENYKKPGTVG